MRFSDIKGNRNVVRALAGMVDSGKVPHAIMFSENDGGGAMRIALAFLQYLYCANRSEGDSCGSCPSCNKTGKLIHPDVHFVFPVAAGVLSSRYIKEWRDLVAENPDFTESELDEALGIDRKSSIIPVAESKTLLETLSLTPLEGGYGSVLIYLPEKMNQEAANRLLKIIEEPPLKTQFILITHSPEKVLRTISSRCLNIRILPPEESRFVSFESPEILDSMMDALLSRNLTAALDTTEALSALPGKESGRQFCAYASEVFRKMFLIRRDFTSLANCNSEDFAKLQRWAIASKPTFPRAALSALDRASAYLGRNVNPRIVFADLVDRLYTSF